LSKSAKGLITYIAKSIATTLGKFRLGAKFTTKTVTLSTTASIISNACLGRPIQNSTSKNTAKRTGGGGESGLSIRCNGSQSVGTSQNKGVNGTGSTLRSLNLENMNRPNESAISAVRHFWQRLGNPAFVPINAGQMRDGKAVLMTKQESAGAAVLTFESTSTVSSSIVLVPVVAVFDTNEKAPVYNLTVEGGEYFANGILVHNCDAMRYMVMFLDGKKPRRRALSREY
jgi:hypothetical protein